MTTQRLHAALAPIDILTREELEEVTTKQFDTMIRDRFRGIDSARLPPITGQGNGATLNLGSTGTSDGIAGPEQGDVWLLRRANVVSSLFATDMARYVLFRGSTPSDPGQYTNRQLLNGISAQLPSASPAAGTGTGQWVFGLPASGAGVQNNTIYPQFAVITGGAVTLVTVNGVTVGTGDGTYLVPSGSVLAITYSSAPVVTPVMASASFQLGQQVGVEYDAPNKGALFQPGEQLYAQVFNTTVGNTYILSGEFIRCPAEMKGKLLG